MAKHVEIQGKLEIQTGTQNTTINLDGNTGNATLGGNGQDGNLQLRSSAGENTIFLGGEDGTILVGNTLKLDGKNGSIVLKDWTLSVPDYVFEEDYKLRALDELRSYIDKQKHLPEIPSAEKIHAEGINLSEFCMSLLKKIEELSLYVLQQHEAIQQQSDRLTQLERSAGMERGGCHV